MQQKILLETKIWPQCWYLQCPETWMNKLAHKVVDVVDRANRKICVTLLRYNVDKPESSYARIRFFARKQEDEKFQQVVSVN